LALNWNNFDSIEAKEFTHLTQLWPQNRREDRTNSMRTLENPSPGVNICDAPDLIPHSRAAMLKSH